MRNVLVAVVVALATALHASVWFLVQERVAPPNANGALASVSFSPINPNSDGEVDTHDRGPDQVRPRGDRALHARDQDL